MIITDEMKRAIDLIENTNDCIYITGKAGTGKTTFLRHIVQACKKKFVVTASTGIAAINAGGVTLHSLFNIPLGVNSPNEKVTSINKFKIELMNAIDVLIIDEISMVRPDTIDYINQKLRIYRKSKEPFGGVQVVMFGDLYQLPPVVKGDERAILLEFYQGVYFFHANVFQECGFHIVELNQVFRQSDPHFVEMLNRIRSYRPTSEDINHLEELRNKRKCADYAGKHIHICSLRQDVQRINSELLGKATHTYNAIITDNFNINSAPCEEKLSLRVGARIMMLVNNKNDGYCNGSLGIIESLEDEYISVRLDDDRVVGVLRYEWSTIEYKMKDGKIESEIKGTCKQFPVTLAWAITIHKSQGLTFDSIAIHTQNVFCPGQIYVALSRCTSLEGIVSDVFIGRRHIFPNYELLSFEKAYKQNGYIFNNKTYDFMKKHESNKGKNN